MTSKDYAGIGARKTPYDVRQQMIAAAASLGALGFTLRTGGAWGADSAFELGAVPYDRTELYLPWEGYNNKVSPWHKSMDEAYAIAAEHHPAWDRCNDTVRKLHARNVHILLGPDLTEPVRFVMCWTYQGKDVGGSGMGIRIARTNKIPIFNLGSMTPEEIETGITPYVS